MPDVLFPSRDIAPWPSLDVHFRVVAGSATQGSAIPGGQAVGRAANMTLITEERDCAEQLARFFPGLSPLRIPVRVLPHRTGQSKLRESTVVEFGGKEFAIFVSALPLEFDDRVRIVHEGEGKASARPAEAIVVALQYHEGRKAVAVRFVEGSCEWMMQP